MYRYRRYRRRREVPPAALAAAGVLVLAALHAQAHAASGHSAADGHGHLIVTRAAAPDPMAARVIRFARDQLGKPYVYGAAGPDAFDCSGLAWAAWADAGLNWSRTTAAQQYADGKQVTDPQPGDLVFFAGADGTPSSPGHVGIVVSPARHLMIDAYATGWPVEYDTYGPGATMGGLSVVVGFTNPGGA
jgi:cell wall-associated NlpC family hydrolase